jgi:hypothetical protein
MSETNLMGQVSPQVWRSMLRAAFEPHVGIEGVQRAVSLWITQYSDKADMQAQVRPFVYTYSQMYGTFELRLNLTLQLLTMLRTPPSSLPEDPQYASFDAPMLNSDEDSPRFSAPSQSASPGYSSPGYSSSASTAAPAAAFAAAVDLISPLSSPSGDVATLHTPASTSVRPLMMVGRAQDSAEDEALDAQDNGRVATSAIAASQIPSRENTLVTLLLKLRETLAQMPRNSAVVGGYDRLMFAFAESKTVKLDAEQVSKWIAWVQAPYRRPMGAALKPKQCTQIINEVYVYLSEQLGPVQADEGLSRAIALCEDTPTGRLVSPRQFL